MTVWDPDGDGPKPELLIVAGTFTFAGSVAVNNIAAWDGQSWSALGTGLTNSTGTAAVYALTVFNGDLIAGGLFGITTPTGSAAAVAKWDGAQWAPVGGNFGNYVTALCVHQTELIAAGTFEKINATNAHGLAAYDGVAWREFGGGIWDGFANAVASIGNVLYVGGKFKTAGSTSVNNIAAWNGSLWDNMEFGILLNVSQTGVVTMAVSGTDLVVGGGFDTAGGNSAPNVALWNGTFWEPMNTGVATIVYGLYCESGTTIAATSDGLFSWNGWVWTPISWSAGAGLKCLSKYAGELHVAGGFNFTAPSGYCGIAKQVGGSWVALSHGLTFVPNVMLTFNDILYVGFSSSGSGSMLLAWDGSHWFDPFQGGPTYWSSVTALGVHQGELVVAGKLVTRSGSPGPQVTIARWRLGAWQRIGVSGGVANGNVLAIASYGGDLFLGGDFISIDAQNATRIARWDGIAWRSMGGVNGTVRCLAEFDGKLIIGGQFIQAGAVSVRQVASWTAQGFAAMGAGLDSTVRTVAVFQGSLYAGGAFLRTGTTAVRGVARWNGSAWTVVTANTTSDVYSLAASDLGLVAVGSFATIAPGSHGIARWTGSEWAGFGTGLNSTVTGLALWKNEIVVSGSFTTANGILSWGLARWSDTGKPAFVRTPANLDRGCGSSASFAAPISSGYGSTTFSWRLNGQSISPALNPSAATDTLLIDPVSHATDGIYECSVSSSCGSITTPAVALISSCCPADLNYDGAIDDADFQIFVVGYDILICGEPSTLVGCPADQNRDGVVDDADFVLFLAGYDALECP